MTHPHETETKLKVDSHQAVRAALESMGTAPGPTFLQTDTYYDREGRQLFHAGCGLRLRTFKWLDGPGQGEDRRPLLTFKGPVDPDSRIKRRREIQTYCESSEAMAGILEALDVQPVMVIQKRRTSWAVGECQVELDELPNLGTFVEIEGPGESAVEELAEKLGLGDVPHIEKSYLQLAHDNCRRHDGPCEEFTFENCHGCDNARTNEHDAT
ncbi:MAG: class IV adenylate cyclase [Phycisphaerae bacterium]